MIIWLTVYLFSLSLPVSLPSYISHTYSISLTLPSSSQSGAPHLHISLALSRFILHSSLSRHHPRSFFSLPSSPDVSRLFPILYSLTTLFFPSSLFLICVRKNVPSLNPTSSFISPSPLFPLSPLQSPSVRMCG